MCLSLAPPLPRPSPHLRIKCGAPPIYLYGRTAPMPGYGGSDWVWAPSLSSSSINRTNFTYGQTSSGKAVNRHQPGIILRTIRMVAFVASNPFLFLMLWLGRLKIKSFSLGCPIWRSIMNRSTIYWILRARSWRATKAQSALDIYSYFCT
jgi:hypothetical protein